MVLPARALVTVAQTSGGTLVGGELHVTTNRLERTSQGFAGDAQVRWSGARFVAARGAPTVDLGEVELRLSGTGARLFGPIVNRGGELALSGEVEVRANGAARCNLVATPRGAVEPAVAAALAGLGRPDGAGWRLEWQGGGR